MLVAPLIRAALWIEWMDGSSGVSIVGTHDSCVYSFVPGLLLLLLRRSLARSLVAALCNAPLHRCTSSVSISGWPCEERTSAGTCVKVSLIRIFSTLHTLVVVCVEIY